MKVVVCIGGNKTVCADRLGIKVAETLQAQNHEVWLLSPKGKVRVATHITLKEYANVTTTKKLADTLIKSHADMVISMMNLRACEASALANVPFIYVEYENFKEDKPIKTKKTLLQKATRVLVLGNSEKPLPKTKYGANAQRLAEPAVWVEHYNFNKPACFKKDNNILAVGPLAKESGFDTLLQTWVRLAPAHKTWHLTLVGDGTQKASLQKFITSHHLQGSTEIVSGKNDVYSLLRNADIFAYPAINPSRADILLDAMASKLPCVACESSAVTSLITNGVNGVVVNAGEEEPFTVALDDLMVNWGKRVGIAVEASKHKDRYSFACFMQAICTLLK